MPQHQAIPMLYNQSLKIMYNLIYDCCYKLYLRSSTGAELKLQQLHDFLINCFPTSVLDDLLEYHYAHGTSGHHLISYYFFRVVLHSRVQCFRARNMKMLISDWRSVFEMYFGNLVTLNLALSCNDQILELISLYCPNLENLNATCKYERIKIGDNACTFALSVTDNGLSYLCRCTKLRTITINEPRSSSRCIKSGITYAGLRCLLSSLWRTLEDVSYSDLGSVVKDGLEHQSSLNLKRIRHFNATVKSIREILRLCKNLQEIVLTFFNSEPQDDIWTIVMAAKIRLRALEVVNLNCKNCFNELFQSLGPNLKFLSISNSFFTISFSDLVTIAEYCPNLTYLSCSQVVKGNEAISHPKSLKQLSKLESLHIQGSGIDVEKVLKFCTENAEHLENLQIIEKRTLALRMDKIFVESVPSRKLKHIETSLSLVFTEEGVRNLLRTYPNLNYINIACMDDCKILAQEIKQKNYDLIFINKTFIPFPQY